MQVFQYFVNMQQRMGEHVTLLPFCIQFATELPPVSTTAQVKEHIDSQAHALADVIASQSYDEPDQDDTGYYFEGGTIHVSVQKLVPISGEDFDTLSKYVQSYDQQHCAALADFSGDPVVNDQEMTEWQAAVAAGETVLGLHEWLEEVNEAPGEGGESQG